VSFRPCNCQLCRAFPAYDLGPYAPQYLVPARSAAKLATARWVRMPHHSETTSNSARLAGYVDYFSDSPHNKPVVLDDGTSVLFPKDWTDEDADKWRKGMDLLRPSQSIHSGYPFH